MQAEKRFTSKAAQKLRSEIEDADGNEVFAFGYLDEKNQIHKIEVAARGNIDSVLALQNRLDSINDNVGDEDSNTPDVLIHNHPSGNLTPSDPDMDIASRAAEGGLGSFIVDNLVEKVYAIAEPARKRKRQKLDSDSIISALEEGGAIASRLPAYEPRQSQLDLMRLVIQAFNEDALAAAEAGTGVGKSFAYLLPAMAFALLNDERVVISTATINLQQQLYEKDIPLVAAALPKVLSKARAKTPNRGPQQNQKKIKAVLIKGRGNYICRRRMEEALKEPSLDEEENESLNAIVLWAEKAETGSRSELSFVPQEGLWSRVCSEGDLCMGLRCPERERCFVMALRREAADANILVVNHHLLFADLAARQGGAGYDNTVVLPPFRRVIIDEAHNIEEAATSFFSGEFSRIGIFRTLTRLYRKRRRGTVRSGLLLRLAALLPSDQAQINFADGMDGDDKISLIIEKVRAAMDDLDEVALELCAQDGVFRLTAQKESLINSALKGPLLTLKKNIQILAGFIRDMLELVPENSGQPQNPGATKSAGDEGLIWEIKAMVRHLENCGSLCASFTEYQEHPDKVMWIEKHSGRLDRADWTTFTETPLEVAHNLNDSLFAPNKTVVCVSATLTVGQGDASFNFWKNRCGLNLTQDREILSGIFPSPFPYHKSVLLGVPDAPMPTEPGFSVFVDNAAAQLCGISGGSALVLFTSYTALKSAYENAKPLLEEQGIRVFKQGDDDRSRLLKAFLEDQSSVLFATDSFWEGVDAPGDTLRLVIICRLPFKTPNDPVFEARCEWLEQAGGNSFMDLSLPEAVMKFKQGFGRLMRRSSDRGVVVVLDSRLLKKTYGRIFLQSLPETRTCFGDFENLLRNVEDFLF